MQAIELLLGRTSNGKLSEPEPDGETLRLAFEAATRAPDHAGLHPWRMYVVRADARTKLGNLMAECTAGRNPAADSDELDKVRKKALRAPMIIVVGAVLEPHPKVPQVEQLLAAGAAAHALLYVLQARGYAGIWRTGDFAYDPIVKKAFGLREQDALVGFIYTGTAKQPAPSSIRAVPAEFVREWSG
jgi:nitroreductase